MIIKFAAGYEFNDIDEQDTQTFPIPRIGDFVDGCTLKRAYSYSLKVNVRLVVSAVVFDLLENAVIIELDRP